MARISAGKREPIDAETASKIEARLAGKGDPAGNGFQDDVGQYVHQMLKSGRRAP